MPEIARIAELNAARASVDDRVRDARILVDDLAKEQRKADADVEQVKTRRTRDRDRMDSGQISNPRDLERMQHELVSLERRINDLEDVELDIMERLETAQAEFDRSSAELSVIDEQLTTAGAARDDGAGVVNEEIVAVTEQRKVTTADLPEDLLTLYTRLREQKGGVGAAALRSRECTGCQLRLNASDLSVISKAPSDEVIRCEECNRILVRTSESGL